MPSEALAEHLSKDLQPAFNKRAVNFRNALRTPMTSILHR